jgi:small-conductance mechanosensitive channel
MDVQLLRGAQSHWLFHLGVTLLILLAAALTAVILHLLATRLAARLARRSASRMDDIFLKRVMRPSRWIMIAIAISLALRAAPLAPRASAFLDQLSGFIVPALVGWLALALLWALRDMLELRADISTPDNLAARRKHTRIGILARIAAFAIIFLTICMMLVSIPGVRSVGVTLMASAGIAGLVVGAAAQPALKNIIAGIQMAFSEPIRIDDVVIIEGEWGRIEEIRLTYVVVRIWDDRRLIVPISKFLESPFQNWTRETSQLLGTAFLYVDPTADVPKLRGKLQELIRDNPNWDGRVAGLQVTDVRADVIELRALVSAADAGKAFDLRCDVREGMMAFIQAEMPDALPRRRGEVSGRIASVPAA